MSTQALAATRPIIEARLKRVTAKNHRPGVLGLRAAPVWNGDGGGFTFARVPVTVAACPSTLAVWEAIDRRADGEWLVVLTPIDEHDLGDGILAHLIDGRLMSPDPWAALSAMFSASTIEPALYRVRGDRALAMGLLAALAAVPDRDVITPAPGGVLTRTHTLAAVAHGDLGITEKPDTEIDRLAVLDWSTRGHADDAVARMRAEGGDELTTTMLTWLGDRCGPIGRIVAALAAAGHLDELMPVGIIAGVLTDTKPGVEKARGKLEERYRVDLDAQTLAHWHTAAGMTMTTLDAARRRRVYDSAGQLVADLRIEALADGSQMLPRGLRARIVEVAAAIDAALAPGPEGSGPAGQRTPAGPPVTAAALEAVEDRWDEAGRHDLAHSDRDYTLFGSAVRLVRWLARDEHPVHTLAEATDRHVRDDAWADAAVTAVRRGVDDAYAAATLKRLIGLAEARRRRHDRTFAEALAAAPDPAGLAEPVPVVENLLETVVLPLARERPTLLLVVDALTLSAATDIAGDALGAGWSEGSVLCARGRTGALAVLPTLTGRSRTSLLAGQLLEGSADTERTAFLEAAKAAGLSAKPGAVDPIFHKKALDARPAGQALATDVKNAIDDGDGRPLVAAVLNYVDDTLHHTDPGGTDWTIDTITHLRALLAAARRAGRAVIVTSDHGHIIERDSNKRDRTALYGLRAHGELDRVGDGEVLVEGARVLTDSGKAVLAVDADIRYGNRNAGYHGGGSPAEVIVPVIALFTGARPAILGSVGQVEPSWWARSAIPPASTSGATVTGARDAGHGDASNAAAGPGGDARPQTRRAAAPAPPSLFDEPEVAGEAAGAPTGEAVEGGAGRAAGEAADGPAGAHGGQPDDTTGRRIVESALFAQQMRTAGRVSVSAEQIAEVLDALLAAPARELPDAQVAALLGVAPRRVGGAVMHIKKVLDVDGYQVLEIGSGVVSIDDGLLREQFGV